MVDRALDDLNTKIEAKKFVFAVKDRQKSVSKETLPKGFFGEESFSLEIENNKENVDKEPVFINDTSKRQLKKTMSFNTNVVEREKDVVLFIKEKGIVSGMDLSLRFSNLSQKTLQRTLAKLIADNAVKKEGDKRWSTYSAV